MSLPQLPLPITNCKLAIIGLGYVGLPLAQLFSTKYPVVGYDTNHLRVKKLLHGLETSVADPSEAYMNNPCHENPAETGDTGIYADLFNRKGLVLSSKEVDIADANIYIITVPTPIDKNNQPDLRPLLSATKTVARFLKKNDIVIYESTVYPGVTEEECVPLLEKESGLTFNSDFFCGYSPERINPGDKDKTLENIIKVTSGSTPEVAAQIDSLYRSVITAGTHLAPSIKVAEASKVIENAQRDINIAFMNELAKIFKLMNINTHDVLEAAGTKWNFLPFKPGLVGGHCIGVDPFYLAQKAQEVGHFSELILTARRINDSMGSYVGSEVIKAMIRKDIHIKGAEVLVLGITFKENCSDIRNSKVVDVIRFLEGYDVSVTIYDPRANPEEVQQEYGLTCLHHLSGSYCEESPVLPDAPAAGAKYDAIVLAVAHDEFIDLDLEPLKKENVMVYDVKGVLSYQVDAKL